MAEQKLSSIEQRVLDAVRRSGLIKSGRTLLVAVSGGADSVCLLHLLHRLQSELQISLRVAHFDHQLRGLESAADAQFVEELARGLGLPFNLKRENILAYRAERQINLEEAAREARYIYLAETARLTGAAAVATGHNQNDQAETILMHLIRGSGTLGLQGLRPVHTLSFSGQTIVVIRPLLAISRTEIEEYCRINNLSCRQDSSNLSLALLRNRIRLELLPLLASYNPDIVGALLRIGRIARDESSFLEDEASRLFDQISSRRGENIILDKKGFLNLAPALQRQLLRRAIAGLRSNLRDIETRHIESMLSFLTKPAGRQLHLPENILLSTEYDRYILGRNIQALVPFPEPVGETTLEIPGITSLKGWQVQSEILSAGAFSSDPESRQNWLNDGFTADFDAEATGEDLTMRCLRPGDVFQPLGLNQPKKVARFMLDARIPRSWRSRVPLICNSSQIIWVAGWRIDERVKVTNGTRSILRLRLVKQDVPTG